MNITLVAAIDENGGIGKDGDIPWRRAPWKMRTDMRIFKSTTEHKTVIMGRRTYTSIGRPLANRLNIVLSSETLPGEANVYRVQSMEEALKIARRDGRDTYLIGGRRVYEEGVKYANNIELTEIANDFECDTFFPPIQLSHWVSIDENLGWYPQDEDNTFAFRRLIYTRRRHSIPADF